MPAHLPQPLRYLQFDLSLDAEGGLGADASASVTALHWPALQAEVAGLLAWADALFPGEQGPVEEGGQWGFELHGSEETSVPQPLDWQPTAPASLVAGPQGAPLRRHTVYLNLHGGPAFAAAFAAQFGAALGQGLADEAAPVLAPRRR